MIDTDKYGMTNEELLERYSSLSVDEYKELLAEVKRLRKDIISILRAIDLPDYDEFPLTQEELRNMMTKYGQEHLIGEGY
jgi:hypothetical protein